MKAKLTVASATLLVLFGAALMFVGVWGFAGRYDIDADRSGIAVVGLVYGLLGALLAFGGWRLLRHRRRHP
jgi:hypothetical protein